MRLIGTAKLDASLRVSGDIATTNSWPHRFGTSYANSRSSLALGDRACPLRWSVQLPDGLEPSYLLGDHDHVVVVGAAHHDGTQRCAIFGRDGGLIGEVVGCAGAWALDPRASVLLGRDRQGSPAVWTLASAQLHAVMLLELENREITDLAVCGELVVLATAGLPGWGAESPDAMLDIARVDNYSDRSQLDTLRAAELVAQAVRDESPPFRFVIVESGLAIATEGTMLWTDWALGSLNEYSLGMLDVALSRHDDGSVLVLGRDPGAVALATCNQHAVQARVPLADALADAGPALIAPNGDCCVASRTQIRSLRPSGAVAWEFSRTGAAGALVGAGSEVVFAQAEHLLRCDTVGRCTTLFSAPAAVETAPIRIGERLHIATGERLLCLSAARGTARSMPAEGSTGP